MKKTVDFKEQKFLRITSFLGEKESIPASLRVRINPSTQISNFEDAISYIEKLEILSDKSSVQSIDLEVIKTTTVNFHFNLQKPSKTDKDADAGEK